MGVSSSDRSPTLAVRLIGSTLSSPWTAGWSSVGADAYVPKPFRMRELLARVRAMLRRKELDLKAAPAAVPSGAIDAETITVGPIAVSPTMRTATVRGTELELTPKEFDLLYLLAANAGRAFAREYLMWRVWGYGSGGFDRTVDTHVLRLRKKLGPFGERIETVWGVGYKSSAAR